VTEHFEEPEVTEQPSVLTSADTSPLVQAARSNTHKTSTHRQKYRTAKHSTRPKTANIKAIKQARTPNVENKDVF